ncbi:MAG: hypothetical protein ACI4SO_02160 [Muribaculaceae bacterium]
MMMPRPSLYKARYQCDTTITGLGLSETSHRGVSDTSVFLGWWGGRDTSRPYDKGAGEKRKENRE